MKNGKINTTCVFLLVILLLSCSDKIERPNIILIMADDMGYETVGCYGSSEYKTPNLDRLASQGAIFTDVHTPSAVCTPTRYGLLTGRYAWRTRMKSGVLWGYSPYLIDPARPTLASMLKKAGYQTSGVGKWHLGDAAHYPENQGFDVNDLKHDRHDKRGNRKLAAV
mgnify:CR=1 FL=1